MLTRQDVQDAIGSTVQPVIDFFFRKRNTFIAWLMGIPVVKGIVFLVAIVVMQVAIMIAMFKLLFATLSEIPEQLASLLSTASGSSASAGSNLQSAVSVLAHGFDVVNTFLPLTEFVVLLFAWFYFSLFCMSLKMLLSFYRLIPFKSS